jgi:hypothetical protein
MTAPGTRVIDLTNDELPSQVIDLTNDVLPSSSDTPHTPQPCDFSHEIDPSEDVMQRPPPVICDLHEDEPQVTPHISPQN